MERKKDRSSGLIMGVILICVGVIWVLINYDILDFSIDEIWPVFIVLFGILLLIRDRKLNHPFAYILIIMGIGMSLASFELIDEWDWYDAVNLWPIALIIIGVSIIFKKQED